MVREEELSYNNINDIFEECEFTNKKADINSIKNSFIKQPGILTLNGKIKNIQGKITSIIEKFNLG